LTATEWTINQLIEERAQAVQEEPQPLDLWDEDKRSRQEREQARARWEWIRFHEDMVRLHHGIAAEHEERAARLLEDK
jgi:hypothetical protein